MIIVVALGGNALLKRGEPLDFESQRENARTAAAAIARIARDHDVVVTHGNGPQVGFLALQSHAYRDAPPSPLDILGAESEGMIGYIIEQELRNVMPDRSIATLLTQVEVLPDDVAFTRPTKPIGPIYEKAVADRIQRDRGWTFAGEANLFRRVVASPEPRRILGIDAVRTLVGVGAVVICAGGGGIPVINAPNRGLRGVEAVVDKDLTAALLGSEIGAQRLLMLTDVSAVWSGWGTPHARAIRGGAPEHIRQFPFEEGSMGPKVEAACRFAENTGGEAGIGALEDAAAILAHLRGTVVNKATRELSYHLPGEA